MAREAYSLQQLEEEIQELYPGTTTWEEGDKKHQATWSDHNPNKTGVYCAKDILSDDGLPLQKFVDHVLANPHPNLRYVIFNRKIYQRKNNFKAQDYNGINAHKTHVHISVGNGPDGRSTSGYDSRATWNLHRMGSTTPPKPQQPKPTENWTDKLMTELPEVSEGDEGRWVNVVQALLNIAGAGLKEDGRFGPRTKDKAKDWQRSKKLEPDGIIGKRSWPRLIKG